MPTWVHNLFSSLDAHILCIVTFPGNQTSVSCAVAVVLVVMKHTWRTWTTKQLFLENALAPPRFMRLLCPASNTELSWQKEEFPASGSIALSCCLYILLLRSEVHVPYCSEGKREQQRQVLSWPVSQMQQDVKCRVFTKQGRLSASRTRRITWSTFDWRPLPAGRGASVTTMTHMADWHFSAGLPKNQGGRGRCVWTNSMFLWAHWNHATNPAEFFPYNIKHCACETKNMQLLSDFSGNSKCQTLALFIS